MKAFCLISHYPRECWLKLLNTFILYDVYIIVDDNSQNYQELYGSTYHNIKFIQIDKSECINSYFIDQDFPNEKLGGWHKALYYFSNVNNYYENVWFCEDDVFFYDENTINNIDMNYVDSDLLSSELSVNELGSREYWHWYKITVNYQPPFYSGMMCAVRMSQKLLHFINDYAKTYKSLFYIEAMFPTVAKHNGLICNSPDEMKYIYFQQNFSLDCIKQAYFYHPIKDFELHRSLREQIENV